MKKNIFFTKLCLIFMMLLGGTSLVSAEEPPVKLTVTPNEFVPGTETVITIAYDHPVGIFGFNLDVTLPKGLTIVGKEVVDEDGESSMAYFEKGSALLESHIFNHNFDPEKSYNAETGITSFRVLVENSKLKDMKPSGSLFTFTVKVSDELADNAQILLTKVKFKGLPYFEQAFDIKKAVSTGINGVEAESQDAEAVYSIGGVRLNKAAKGVNIVVRNGKAIKVVK